MHPHNAETKYKPSKHDKPEKKRAYIHTVVVSPDPVREAEFRKRLFPPETPSYPGQPARRSPRVPGASSIAAGARLQSWRSATKSRTKPMSIKYRNVPSIALGALKFANGQVLIVDGEERKLKRITVRFLNGAPSEVELHFKVKRKHNTVARYAGGPDTWHRSGDLPTVVTERSVMAQLAS